MAATKRRSAPRTNALNPLHPKYAAKNATKGSEKPRKIGKGGEPALPINAPRRPRTRTSPSHSANAPKTTDLMLHGLSLSSDVRFSLMLPILSFVMFIYVFVLILRFVAFLRVVV